MNNVRGQIEDQVADHLWSQVVKCQVTIHVWAQVSVQVVRPVISDADLVLRALVYDQVKEGF